MESITRIAAIFACVSVLTLFLGLLGVLPTVPAALTSGAVSVVGLAIIMAGLAIIIARRGK